MRSRDVKAQLKDDTSQKKVATKEPKTRAPALVPQKPPMQSSSVAKTSAKKDDKEEEKLPPKMTSSKMKHTVAEVRESSQVSMLSHQHSKA